MTNAHIAGAAEGLPNSTRRSFVASVAAVAVTAPVTIASATTSANDPVFAAIDAWLEADTTWRAKLDKWCEAETACASEKAIGHPRIDVEICGVPFTFRSDEDISYFLRTLPNRGASATENIERLQAAGQNFRNALDAERERVAKVRLNHDIDALEAASTGADDEAKRALGDAVATVPTTLAGIRALAELMAVPDRLCVGQDETGLASLATACRALLPE